MKRQAQPMGPQFERREDFLAAHRAPSPGEGERS